MVLLCAEDTERLYGFEPDMGDGIDWHPGICAHCKRSMIVFEIEEGEI